MMKVQKHPIDLDKRRYLVFDLNAMYELEKIYGSFDAFFDVTKEMNERDIFNFIKVGLLHVEGETDELDPGIVDYYQQSDVYEKLQVKMKVLQAFISAWSDSNKEESQSTGPEPTNGRMEWDWDWFYYVGNTLLNMPESVFWRSTPNRFLAQWKMHRKYHGLDKLDEKQQQEHQAIIDQYV